MYFTIVQSDKNLPIYISSNYLNHCSQHLMLVENWVGGGGGGVSNLVFYTRSTWGGGGGGGFKWIGKVDVERL